MEFLQKRRITDLGESQEDLSLAFLDLTYSHSNKIFHLLVSDGLIQDDGSSQALASFLEIVSFVHCRIEMAVKRRARRQGFEDLDLMFANIKMSWGAFFADPPDGPRLENASVESVRDMITHRCDQYHTLYLSALQTQGQFHALKTCCATLLENVLPEYLIGDANLVNNQKRQDDLGEAVSSYIRESVYDLDRDVQVILAQDQK